MIDAGIVDQRVEAAGLRRYPIDCRAHLRIVGHVQGDGPHSFAFELVRLGAADAAKARVHDPSLTGQAAGGRVADAAAAARDQRNSHALHRFELRRIHGRHCRYCGQICDY